MLVSQAVVLPLARIQAVIGRAFAIGPDAQERAEGVERVEAPVKAERELANTRQISDMVGMSEPMVARYTRFSVQRENASAAVVLLDRTFRERKRESDR